MAVLAFIQQALDEPVDPRLLAKAIVPGRVRGVAEQLDSEARANLRGAAGVLRRGLRDARMLHSRERRMVSDALYDGFRWGPILELATGLSGFEGRWTGWLLLHGLQLEQVPQVDAEQWGALLTGELEVPEQARAGGHGVWPVMRAALGDRAEAFVAASDARAPVHLRVNHDAVSRANLIAQLEAAGIEVQRCRFAPHGLEVIGRANLLGTKAYSAGLFEIQDEGSQLLAELVEPTGLVVDLCAGAGGKSLAMAATGTRVEAFDVRDAPLRELERRARRAKLPIGVTRLRSDGALPERAQQALANKASRVLVDAPCSGSGTWRRHPELRWRLAEVDAIVQVQAAILDRAAMLVKPGGWLVYGTCSVLPRENQDQVEAFLASHPEFSVRPVARSEVASGPFLQVAPDTHGTDGFFGAVLERRG